jgi:hypothetical protein
MPTPLQTELAKPAYVGLSDADATAAINKLLVLRPMLWIRINNAGRLVAAVGKSQASS